jgi:hypothetical protein
VTITVPRDGAAYTFRYWQLFLQQLLAGMQAALLIAHFYNMADYPPSPNGPTILCITILCTTIASLTAVSLVLTYLHSTDIFIMVPFLFVTFLLNRLYPHQVGNSCLSRV